MVLLGRVYGGIEMVGKIQPSSLGSCFSRFVGHQDHSGNKAPHDFSIMC
jgi:hypothetical protein